MGQAGRHRRGEGAGGSPDHRGEDRTDPSSPRESASEAGAGFLKKITLLLRQEELVEPFEMIAAEKDNHPVAMMCKQLGVSRSGYYAFKRRCPSTRQREDAEIVTHIKESHAESWGTYGSPRVLDDLKDKGFRVGKKRVARRATGSGSTAANWKPSSRRDCSWP